MKDKAMLPRPDDALPTLPTLIAEERLKIAMPLNDEQRRAVTQWAADDRLWTTPDTVAFNLAVFARVILAANR